MRRMLTVLIVLLVLTGTMHGQQSKPAPATADSNDGPQVGQPAPDFELPWADQEAIHAAKDQWIKLSALKGSNVILAFYAADWSGG
jgi:hypothetical protein